ncbi:MAG: helix-turn-helix domain-containing protein [Pseudomonadota bacterium]|nr:helix-turn-helix domain-containing protein [Pseudomonadota bacterium]
MTPFGLKIREFRANRRLTLKQMAKDLGVSSAYFSALEHGHRGRPGPGLIQQISGYFGLSWEETESLQRLVDLSAPRVVVDTSGLTPSATELANVIAKNIQNMDDDTIEWVINEINGRIGVKKRGGPSY